MNRLTIAAAVAATACAISIPTVAALGSADSTNSRGPSQSRPVDNRSGPNRGSDDVTRAAVVVRSASVSTPKDDKGTHVEPGDDRGSAVEPGDDNGTDAPGDDNGTAVEPGDDNGTDARGDDNGGSGGSGSDHSGPGGSGDDGGHHGHDG